MRPADRSELESQRLASERLGRVAKVAGEQSFLRCGGQPPAQRDLVYRARGRLSIQFAFRLGWHEPVSGATLEQALFVQNKGVGPVAELSHE